MTTVETTSAAADNAAHKLAAAIDAVEKRHRRPGLTAKAKDLWKAATQLLQEMEQGAGLNRHSLRRALERSFGADDATGAWNWKDAYEAAEIASTLFILRYADVLKLHGGNPHEGLDAIRRIGRLEPPQTRRSEQQLTLQQFSTPLDMAYVAAIAGGLQGNDIVLEPSAGTGTLAAMALPALDAPAGGRLALNELGADRAGLLTKVFIHQPVTRHDAEQIRERLPEVRPSVVIMNPPFSRTPGIEKMRQDADVTHVWSAYAALQPGGRLVAITSASCEPGSRRWDRVFKRLVTPPRVVLSVGMDGRMYKTRGTHTHTRLTVLERPTESEARNAVAYAESPAVQSAEELLDTVLAQLTPRRKLEPNAPKKQRTMTGGIGRKAARVQESLPHDWGETREVDYRSKPPEESKAERITDDRPYHPWRGSVVIVRHGHKHPTDLVESAAMAAVPHREPLARVQLPSNVVTKGKLSDAQLESVVLAVDALSHKLQGLYQISEDFENIKWLNESPAEAAAREEYAERVESDGYGDDAGIRLSQPVEIRQGWMLGDGTGCGKGRQVAGIILDQWLRGRRRALWLSQSDKLIEDARRDWRALGGRDEDVIQLTKIRQRDAIPHSQGVLFATYATLRSPGRKGNRARLHQIIEWLAGGSDEQARHVYDGVIIFDEAHAMQHAAGAMGSRGKIAPSQQGLAGLKLQNALPDARIVYVSATGASSIEGLAYAQRLGLWTSARTPFADREKFVEAMEKGGVAALEIIARDLKAFGLYQTRALSYDGVEIEILVHKLTKPQREIWDEYAGAFQIIHQNMKDALEATNVTMFGETLNSQAKAAAASAFESAKQRFFGHLLTSMKVPTLILAIEKDRAENRSAVIQLVSTGEALTERRLAEIPVDEWDDLSIDLTPREYMLDFLRHSFPTTVHKTVTNSNGDEETIPVFDEHGRPVVSEQAVQMREDLIEKLGALPPIGAALDLLLDHFGYDNVAEITGRSRRILRIVDDNGERKALRPRAGSSNRHETHQFMNGDKRILIFSGAGAIGRSYHADKDCENQDRRCHYLLEPGWRADQAIQGLGRTHRTHQRVAPLFRPVTTDVKGERRFISTIARRLDALGAITRGQRDSQTSMGADKALFRAGDNFESPYALAALRQFYLAIYHSKIPKWEIGHFSDLTGLRLMDQEGKLLEQLPPMPIFLNRLLALPINEQNELFTELETRLEANIQQAIDKGTFAQGVERITADSLIAGHREVACTHANTDSDTVLVEINRRDRVRPLTSKQATGILEQEHRLRRKAQRMINKQSRRAALAVIAPVRILDNGGIERRVRLLRPTDREGMAEQTLETSRWREADEDLWRRTWDSEAERAEGYRESRFWLVTGLLLPIWNRLSESDWKVYRLTTNDGEKLIGRALTASETAAFRAQLGLGASNGVQFNGSEVYDEAMHKRGSFRLAVGWRVRGRQHMDRVRVEIEGPNAGSLKLLKQLGCQTELVSHRTRIFAPNAEVVERIVERYPLAENNASA